MKPDKLQSSEMNQLPGLDIKDPDDNTQEETYRKIGVARSMNFIVVEHLPDPDAADKNCIYLIPKSPKKAKRGSTSTPIMYEEYFVIEGQWKKISCLTNGFTEEEQEPTLETTTSETDS